MMRFGDLQPLPQVPDGLAAATAFAWSLVRELHAQARISSVEGMTLINGLKTPGAQAPVISAAGSPQPQQGE